MAKCKFLNKLSTLTVMEHTKHKLPKKTRQFFNQLNDYIDEKLLFFGSIQRDDYVPGKSDIDIAIFCENEYSTMNKMQHFLKVAKSQFKKIVWKLYIVKDRIVYGYKLHYKNPELDVDAEFSIYNNKFKDDVLKEHLGKMVLPFYCRWVLFIIKILYYHIGILPIKWYSYLKKKTLSRGLGRPDDQFLVISQL